MADLTILQALPQEQITALMDRQINLGVIGLPVTELNSELQFESVRQVELMVTLTQELEAENIDWEYNVISFARNKIGSIRGGRA